MLKREIWKRNWIKYLNKFFKLSVNSGSFFYKDIKKIISRVLARVLMMVYNEIVKDSQSSFDSFDKVFKF